MPEYSPFEQRKCPCIGSRDRLVVERKDGFVIIRVCKPEISDWPGDMVLALSPDAATWLVEMLQATEHQPPHILIH